MAIFELLRGSADERTCGPGTYLFRAGEPGAEMYVVLDGEVEIRIEEVVLETVGTGGILGEMALIDASPRSASAYVPERATVAPIDEHRFMTLIEQVPRFALDVMHVLANRLREMDRVVAGYVRRAHQLEEELAHEHQLHGHDTVHVVPATTAAAPF